MLETVNVEQMANDIVNDARRSVNDSGLDGPFSGKWYVLYSVLAIGFSLVVSEVRGLRRDEEHWRTK